MATQRQLEAFNAAMINIYHSARRLKPRYNPSLFLRMVSEFGGKEAADRLLAGPTPSSGFAELLTRGKENLALSVEHLVLQPEWRDLFTSEQLAVASRRLEEVGFTPPPEPGPASGTTASPVRVEGLHRLTTDELVALARYRGVDQADRAGSAEDLRAALIDQLSTVPPPKVISGKFAGKRIVRAEPYQDGRNARTDPNGHGYKAFALIPRGPDGIRAEDLLARIDLLPAKSSETYGAGGTNHLQWDLDRNHTYLIDDPGLRRFFEQKGVEFPAEITDEAGPPRRNVRVREPNFIAWWGSFTENAKDARLRATILESPVIGNRYRIDEVEADKITILRMDASTSEILTREGVEMGARRILEAGGTIARAQTFSTVAQETAFVELHPAFRWTLDHDAIELVQNTPLEVAALIETPPPIALPSRVDTTRRFQPRPAIDYAELDARNRHLGLAGELLVLRREQESLRTAGREDLAEQVVHVSATQGDGAGYDILSFAVEGSSKYIEVKTTKGPERTPFLISANEIAFARSHADSFFYTESSTTICPRSLATFTSIRDCPRNTSSCSRFSTGSRFARNGGEHQASRWPGAVHLASSATTMPNRITIEATQLNSLPR